MKNLQSMEIDLKKVEGGTNFRFINSLQPSIQLHQ
jgi:hypothetical protein